MNEIQSNNLKIGFIGQGWIGKNYADDFENRGLSVVRYSLEESYVKNKDLIKECDIVFIAVPTPTTKKGFDDSIVRDALSLVGENKIAVIKSTLIPGTTKELQQEFNNKIIIHSPEFLSMATAAYDASNPERNIIGVVEKTEANIQAAELILSLLPKASFSSICLSSEAELIKYSHNIHGFFQIIFSNILFNVVQKNMADWNVIKEACMADTMMSHQYLNPIHKTGRGAGGNCFVKDFKAFRELYETVGDKIGLNVLRALEEKNKDLLISSKKDIELLRHVYEEI